MTTKRHNNKTSDNSYDNPTRSRTRQIDHKMVDNNSNQSVIKTTVGESKTRVRTRQGRVITIGRDDTTEVEKTTK